MIKYNKLFALLAMRGMKKTDLLQVISAPTLAKLSKGDVVKTDILEKICLFLGCQPSDIMEIVEVEEGSITDQKTGKPTKDKIITKTILVAEYGHESVEETYIEDEYGNTQLIDRDDWHNGEPS